MKDGRYSVASDIIQKVLICFRSFYFYFFKFIKIFHLGKQISKNIPLWFIESFFAFRMDDKEEVVNMDGQTEFF